MKSYLTASLMRVCLPFLFLSLVACSSKPNNAAITESESVSNAVNAAEPATTTNNIGSTAQNINPTAKIIRNATVKMQVENFRESLSAIENTIRTYQAYIASSNETHADNQLENTLTIRVPAANLDLLLNKLISHSSYLNYKNITSEDVSTEFIDITARIKSKKAVEERYLTFLKDAKNVKEMLELENEIRKIREEIEATQARINYLNDQTAYSTITLEVYQPTTVVSPTGNTYWVRIVNAIGTGWDMLVSLFIGLLYIWPLLLLIPVVIYFSRWFFQKYPPVR